MNALATQVQASYARSLIDDMNWKRVIQENFQDFPALQSDKEALAAGLPSNNLTDG